jgi:SAM-dependent methyltransferase
MAVRPNLGTGPGSITPDGCAVDFYALLPPAGEAEIVHASIPPDASVLELGCGTGRILRRLAELRHSVFGVDESADMLAHAADLDTVRSSIEALDLGRDFDAVLLASTLINTPDPTVRAAMLATARRHTASDGSVVIQRHRPEWFDTLTPNGAERDGIRFTIGSVHRDGPLLTTTVEYQVDGRRWAHTFTARRLSDGDVARVLRDAGFGHVRWLTEERSWLAASAV